VPTVLLPVAELFLDAFVDGADRQAAA
jgi:hypothetical protein